MKEPSNQLCEAYNEGSPGRIFVRWRKVTNGSTSRVYVRQPTPAPLGSCRSPAIYLSENANAITPKQSSM